MTNTIKTGCLEYPMQNQINAFLEANRQQIINLTSELIKSHNPHNLETRSGLFSVLPAFLYVPC